MNTKKLFMLLAAVLLGSLGAFAQSGNNDPLKGDVNEDGTVDVADITAVIKIMKENATPQTTYYWYIGTTQPTVENYKTIATEVSSYDDIYEYSSKERNYHYILVAEDIPITCRGKSSFGRITISEYTSVNIPGHKVYKTNGALAVGGTICIDLGDEWKHFYFGTNQPTADNYETLTPQYSSLSDMDGVTVHVPSGGKVYLLFPYSDSPSDRQLSKMITDSEGNGVSPQSGENNVKFVGSLDYTSIYRHVIWVLSVDNETTLTFKEPVTYYYYAGWTLPTVDNVESIIAETYPASSGSSVNNTAGKKTTSKSTMDYTSNTLYNANQKTNYYVLVPTGHAIYDSLNNNVIASTFTSQGNITVGNQIHTVYKSNSTSRYINAIIIK